MFYGFNDFNYFKNLILNLFRLLFKKINKIIFVRNNLPYPFHIANVT